MTQKHIRADDLCNYARAAVGGGYCWGAHGEMCTLSFREELARRAPDQSAKLLTTCAKWDGRRVWDCSGLFRGAWRALWNYRSGGATTIWRAWCTGAKGSIGTMPDKPGLAVFIQSKKNPAEYTHIGLYIGDGMAIDANGSETGVLLRKLSAHGWTHWAELDDVDYFNVLPGPEELPALWTGYVKTKTGGGISIWQDNTKRMAIVKVPDGADVDVLGEADEKGFADARYGGAVGVADLRYVLPYDGEETQEECYTARLVGVKVGLNLRTSPELAVNTILLIPPDAIVEVYPDMRQGAFDWVRYAGKCGFATAARLERTVEND